jgi:transposase
MPGAPPLPVSVAERQELERLVRAHTTTQRLVKRAEVILLAGDGVPNRQISKRVGMAERYVAMWRQRFEAKCIEGLSDDPRLRRPRVYGNEDRLRLVATVTQAPPDPASHWSYTPACRSDVGCRHLRLPGGAPDRLSRRGKVSSCPIKVRSCSGRSVSSADFRRSVGRSEAD